MSETKTGGDPKLLEILGWPVTKETLEYDTDAQIDVRSFILHLPNGYRARRLRSASRG